MPNIAANIEVLTSTAEVLPFLDEARNNADKHKDALGFLPAGAYQQAVEDGTLWIALLKSRDKATYVGHLFFSSRFPQLKVVQLFSVPNARGKGIGKLLVKKLIEFGEQNSFLAISARVAADLPANQFWEAQGFAKVKALAGGATTGRTINLRVHQLNTETLFGYPAGAPISALPLQGETATYTPTYVLDLNVIFDVAKKRPRAKEAGAIISAALSNLISVVAAEELTTELKRHTPPSAPDPILEFASQLPTLPTPGDPEFDALKRQLLGLIFPNKTALSTYTAQDLSDVTHLATAIRHSATGFITSENRIVEAAGVLRAAYGIHVLHVATLAEHLRTAHKPVELVQARFYGNLLAVSPVSVIQRAAVDQWLYRETVPEEFRATVAATGVHATNISSLVVSAEGVPVVAAFWRKQGKLGNHIRAFVIGDEGHPAIETAVDALLSKLGDQAREGGQALVIEIQTPTSHLAVQRVAGALRFHRMEASSLAVRLQRLTLPFIIDESNWSRVRERVLELSGITLPDSPAEHQCTIKDAKGNAFSIKREDLERALAPALLATADRTCAIIPIRKDYADELLGTYEQLSFSQNFAASLFHVRAYISSPRNKNKLLDGTLALFYESGSDGYGRSAITAAASILGTTIAPKSEIASAHLKRGVLDAEDLQVITSQQTVAVTLFANTIVFRNPVPLNRLRQLAACDGANLVTVREITIEQFVQIAREGIHDSM